MIMKSSPNRCSQCGIAVSVPLRGSRLSAPRGCDATGFIRLNALRLKVAAKVQRKK
ncbi:MAG TPA: hypothetical protein VIK28_00765 [Sedimentisphaerales bacterium]